MAISEQQREARKQYLGSSEIAAVMGLDEHRSAADLWLEKTGQAEPFAGNENTERGALLEPVILDWAERRIGVGFTRGLMQVSEDKVLAANFDGISEPRNGFLVEAKSSVLPDEWGEEGSDEIPDRTLIQVHHQFVVAGTDYRIAYVPVLLPGYRRFDFRMYTVQRNDKVCAAVAAAARRFMAVNVLQRVRPDDYCPSLEVLKRVRREPNKTIELPDPLVDEWITAKAAVKQAMEDYDKTQATLLAALGDAEAGAYSAGTVTYFETKRKAYEVAASTYRTLRIKANKRTAALAATGAA